ncbi:hypothetical protein D3C78_1147320 [compost metagenome]
MNDTVTAGSWPWWLTDTGPTLRCTLASADSGTSVPLLLRTDSRVRSFSLMR